MAKVIATQRGYHGGLLREPGDVFDADGKASWFVPADGAAAVEAPKRRAPKAKAEVTEAVVAGETAAAGLAPQPDWISDAAPGDSDDEI